MKTTLLYKDRLKNPLIQGTLMLTLTGLLTRFMGFFYKIYLSNLIGEVNLGLYHLIFPVFIICETIYGSGIQTTISKLTAQDRDCNSGKILKTGLIIGCTLAFSLSFLVFHFSGEIALNFLKEPMAASSLKILSILFPFCCTASCINGYYYGKKKTLVPATTQMVEQLFRVVAVFMLTTVFWNPKSKVSCEIAVWGLVVGEIASCLYNLFFICRKGNAPCFKCASVKESKYYFQFLKIAGPLTLTRLSLNILVAAESILIPTMLRKNGMSPEDSLAILGTLTGMALPFILFPSALSNSLAVMLLPSISEAESLNKNSYIHNACTKSIHYCLITGIFFCGIFLAFGDSFGNIFFHNSRSGSFMKILSWLCPFLYLSSTMSSILNGLGKTGRTFFNTAAGLLLRILFLLFSVPKSGIYGYLIGLLVSQLTITLLHFLSVKQFADFSFNAVKSLVKPGLCALLSILLVIMSNRYTEPLGMSNLLSLIVSLGIYSLAFIILYLLPVPHGN